MENMYRVRVPKLTAQIYTEEGDLVEANGGIFPIVRVVLVLQEGQPWYYHKVFVGHFGEEGMVVSGQEVAQEVIDAIWAKGTVNLVEDWNP